MKFRLSLLSIFAALFLFGACSKNTENPEPATPVTGVPEVRTDAATDITMYDARLNGTITNNAGGSILDCGFVYDTHSNPLMGSSNSLPVNAKEGSFSLNLYGLKAGTTYYVRAYVRNENGLAHGQLLSFTTLAGDGAVTKSPYNINGISARFKGQIKSSSLESMGIVTERGFVYSTTPDPTLQNGDVLIDNGPNLDYEGFATGLEPATTYFVRAYARHINGVSYGTAVYFKTAGYEGPSGGIVVLDRGESSGGWRYLEAAPEDVTFGGTFLFNWGCSTLGTLGGTSDDVGAGPDNTMLMLTAGCTGNASAATRADSYVYGSATDWFLPSSGEGYHMVRTLYALDNAINTLYWTSSEADQFSAAVTTLSPSGPFNKHKGDLIRVRPVRRY